MSDRAAVTPQHELRELRRRCWASGCDKTARLDWCGWRYCFHHYWTQVIRDADSAWRKLEKIRFTRWARR